MSAKIHISDFVAKVNEYQANLQRCVKHCASTAEIAANIRAEHAKFREWCERYGFELDWELKF